MRPRTQDCGPSSASHLACGDTITADTTLDSDLTGCPSNGIVIGADDITLDLNGHTIAGDGKPVRRCPRGEFCDTGVVNDGHDGAWSGASPANDGGLSQSGPLVPPRALQ